MFALVAPVRLILLADRSEWALIIEECMSHAPHLGALISAPSWNAASTLIGDEQSYVVLATADRMPHSSECDLPRVLLLEKPPEQRPLDVSDWLIADRLTPEVLSRCLRYVQDQQYFKQQVGRIAEQDPLTGIPNRQGFQVLLTERLAECRGQGLTLGCLDLDGFGRVNDALGHQAGDHLIQEVVSRIRAQLEPGDRLGRLGGDEFALLLDTRRDPKRSLRVADRISSSLAEPYFLGSESLLLGSSLGLASSRGGQGADPLMWHAHLAMQQAKETDGCTYHLFDERLDRTARGQAELEVELRRALRRDELELYYQPRLCLKTNQVVGLEALVRWRHPEQGLLGPNEFIPLAERSGLIVPLGYWVISRALRDMQWLRGRGIDPLHMAINLSFRQFQDSQLMPTLQRLIEERGVDAAWVEFELTETAVMRRAELVRDTMLALSKLGVRFSLDDFGTGFSSFVHLNDLPIGLLKIDKSFVGGMLERVENQKLVRAMIDMAHTLELEVVAEGVESPEHLTLLRSFGCDQVQGYWISKPVPLTELARFLVFGVRRVQLSPVKH